MTGPCQAIDKLVELACPADEGGPCRHDLRADTRAGLDRLPDCEAIRLPFRLDGLGAAVVDDLVGRTIGRLPDENAVDRRRRLQPSSRVDDIARRHPLARLRPRAEIDQRLTRVHGDPHLHALLLARPVPDRERRPHRPLRIVLVRDRRPEQRHHRIADELLHRAAEPLQLRTQPLVVRAQDRLHVLRVELLGTRGEPDQVGEQHRDDFPLLAGAFHAPSLGRLADSLYSVAPALHWERRGKRRVGYSRQGSQTGINFFQIGI